MKVKFNNIQELNNQISYISEQIFIEIDNFKKKNTLNLNYVLKKLKNIYKYMITVFSNSKVNSISSIVNDNDNKYPSIEISLKDSINSPNKNNNYLITKLKRKLKEEQQENKFRELGYLKELCSLRNELKIYEDEKISNNKKKKNKNEYGSFTCHKTKSVIKNDIRINKDFDDNFSIHPFKTINYLKREKNEKKDNKSIKKRNNNSNNGLSNYHSNTINNMNNLLDKYRIKMYSKDNKKIKNINNNKKHDFREIKKSVEAGKKKIRLLKDSISPVLFSLRNLKINKL